MTLRPFSTACARRSFSDAPGEGRSACAMVLPRLVRLRLDLAGIELDRHGFHFLAQPLAPVSIAELIWPFSAASIA